MKHLRFHNWKVALIAALFTTALHAAENTTGTAAPTATASNAAAAGATGSSGSNAAGPTIQVSEGTFTPATMPANSDRAQKSKASAAAAQAGSAMQQVNCMRAQADAQAEEDPDAKGWKQIAAGMQCQQAQASKESAQKNEETAKSLSGEDIPKPASFTAGAVTISGGIADANIEIPTVNTTKSQASGAAEDPPAPTEESKALASEKPTGESKPTTETNTTPEVGTELPKSALAPIESGSVVYDDSSKNGGGAGGAAGLGTFGNASSYGSGTGKTDKTSTASNEIAKEIAQLERGIRAINEGTGEGSGSDGEAPKSSGILEALMAQLNPDTGAMEGFPSGLAGQELVALEKDPKGAARINIFEYATYRYQGAVTQERLQTKKVKHPRAALRELASKPVVGPSALPADLLSASRTQ